MEGGNSHPFRFLILREPNGYFFVFVSPKKLLLLIFIMPHSENQFIISIG
jgi:hypothetical protein